MCRTSTATVVSLLVGVLIHVAVVDAQDSVTPDEISAGDQPSCADEMCVVEAARSLLRADEAEHAVELLTSQLDDYPDSGPIQILLGVAYLNHGDRYLLAATRPGSDRL